MVTKPPQRVELTFEGYSASEILKTDNSVVDRLVLTGDPIIFRVGSASILGQFRILNSNLLVELAQIEGGGEGVLPALASLIRRYAKQRKLCSVEWTVHAVDCAKPNLKLRRVLERSGFTIDTTAVSGRTYRRVDSLDVA